MSSRNEKRSGAGARTAKIILKVIGRFFAILGVTVALILILVIGACFLAMHGPSPAFRSQFAMFAYETSALKWLPKLFLGNDEFQKIIAENKEARVGALIMYIKHVRLALPLYVMDGVNGIVFTDYVAHSGVTDKMIMQSEMPVSMMLRMAVFVMNAWYGVMIALLHPVVKDVFRKGAKQKEKTTLTDDAGNKKRIVRYVRRRYVSTDKLVDAITGGGQSRTYHALVWHVVGHWRQLPSGKKTFVRPYWKGVMRSLKRNLDEVERQLVLPKEE